MVQTPIPPLDYAGAILQWTILGNLSTNGQGYALNADYENEMPMVIAYAEGRCYRELTLLGTRAQDSSLSFTGNTRSLNLQSATQIILVPEGLAVITPVGSIPALGTRTQFVAASLDVIDSIWQTESQTVDPLTYQGDLYWAMKDPYTIVTAPTMDDTYPAEVTGLFQPAPLSVTNTTTYLSLTYPDVFIAAGMIYVSAMVRNFGAQADKPQMAVTWEDQFKLLALSAMLQEQRLRGAGAGWSPNNPTPIATPPRR